MGKKLQFDWGTETGEAVLRILKILRDAGGRGLLVGGCVRDALLGRENKDFDIEVYGMTLEQLESSLTGKFDYSTVGMSFGVLKIHSLEIDITLPRRENKVGAGHRGFVIDSDPNMDFAEAARRRDFTFNAMMYDPLAEELIDPLNGEEDLKKHLLRHCSPHFAEDPLRVLRGMQFAARFGCDVAPETVELCKCLSQEELPAERLAGEWEKLLLKGTEISRGLEFLRQCGWIRYYPELEALVGCAQSPKWHPEGDVWRHTLLALDAFPPLRCGNRTDDLVLGLAVLCHDFGKPLVSFVDGDGRIVSPNHAVAGLDRVQCFLNRIWQEQEILEMVPPLVQCHMEPFALAKDDASDRAYRRLALKVKRIDLLQKVAICDMKGTSPRPADLQMLDDFLARAKALAVADSQPKPILLGRHLLAEGVPPGKEMGRLLHEAFEAQLDGKFTDLEGALVFVRKLIEAKA